MRKAVATITNDEQKLTVGFRQRDPVFILE
jgi:hypothetical protein